MVFNMLIADCDPFGVPVTETCKKCSKKFSKGKIVRHMVSCRTKRKIENNLIAECNENGVLQK